MNRFYRELCAAKAETLKGWASLLRGMLEQTPHSYKELAEKVRLFAGEMESRGQEWEDSIHPHPPEQRN